MRCIRDYNEKSWMKLLPHGEKKRPLVNLPLSEVVNGGGKGTAASERGFKKCKKKRRNNNKKLRRGDYRVGENVHRGIDRLTFGGIFFLWWTRVKIRSKMRDSRLRMFFFFFVNGRKERQKMLNFFGKNMRKSWTTRDATFGRLKLL